MTDTPTTPPPADLPPENLVDRAVERAAEKVAAAAAPEATPNGLRRWEAAAAIAALVVLNLGGAGLALQIRAEAREIRSDVRLLCTLVAELVPAPAATLDTEKALRLAECTD